ncbi:MAG: hypothetical protein HN919_16535 [Verrucomicrobia bacterium]|jgi:hypothetical protein|nr:hypothetical protein [Verrucomicrobiota bacterium]MBT7067908.1 hypothetical protein [Verrucomicrobiota bacterium]MBT7701820.1 hypothetical protein [Verrucomicrobiota bacterium]
MKCKHNIVWVSGAIALLVLAGSVNAASYIEEFNGSSSADASADPSGTAELELSGSGASGLVESGGTLTWTANPGTESISDRIYLDAAVATEYGDLTAFTPFGGAAVEAVSFDFYSDANNGGGTFDYPADLELYFMSTSGYWRYDYDTTGLSGWNTLSAGMSFGSGWINYGGTTDLATFDTDMASVTELGVLLTYQGASYGDQHYGIDNFALHYPEPGTYAVLAFALMSLGVTFRGKLNSGLKGLLHK